MPDRTTRLAALYATLAAVVAVIVTPLLALSYFAIPDGASELDTGTVSAWADPARDLAGGLLTFGSPDRVYATYTQVIAVLFPAVLVCALLVRAGRPRPALRNERWGWSIALTGYALMMVGLLVASVVLIGASASGDAVNVVFLTFVVPGLLLSTIGSTVLGIGLLRSALRPRAAAWVLALSLPLWLFASVVLGHNGMGLVPIFVAWALAARSLERSEPAVVAPARYPDPVPDGPS